MIPRLLAVALAVTVPLAAQVRETIEVAVTSVDAVVTDARGNRVRGLTRADFEVLEDGSPREITNFSELTVAAPAASPATASVAGEASQPSVQTVPPRRLMLVFDGNTLTPELRRAAGAAALRFVDASVRPSDKVLVGVLTQAFTPRTGWTSDRAELKRVVQAVAAEVTAIGADAQRKNTEAEITELIDVAASFAGSQGGVPPPPFEELVRRAQRYAEEALQESRRTVALIGSLVTQLSAYPEKKALVFIGEGVEVRPGADVFHRLESLRNANSDSPGVREMARRGLPTGSVTLESNKYNNLAVLKELAASAFRKGVPIYAINPGTNEDADVESRDLPERTQAFARFASRAEGYEIVGEGSGGAALVGMRADVALGQVAADLDGYYSLGFRASGPPSRESIVVRVRKPSHRVRLVLAGAPLPPADLVGDAVIAHHVLEPETNDLQIALENGGITAAGEKQKVKLNVIIPIANLELVRQGGEVTGGFDVYLSISDGSAYFSPVNRQSHTIRWPADSVPEDDERTLTYTIDVTLEPGTDRISVGVVDHGSQRTGFGRIEIGPAVNPGP